MTPFVSVSITNHLVENFKYLDVAIRSVLNSVGVPYELWVLSDAEQAPRVPNGVKLIHDRSLNSSTKKTEYYLDNHVHKDAKCLMFMSDDVMITRQTMQNLAASAMTKMAIVAPLSNGEIYAQFLANFKVFDENGEDPIDLKVEMELEDLKGRENILMNYNPMFCFASNQDKILPVGTLSVTRQWVPFFAWAAPRYLIEEVGRMDPKLDCRFSDVDYSLRALRKGFGCFTEMSAFALHFANKSLVKTTDPDKYRKASLWFHAKNKELNEL